MSAKGAALSEAESAIAELSAQLEGRGAELAAKSAEAERLALQVHTSSFIVPRVLRVNLWSNMYTFRTHVSLGELRIGLKVGVSQKKRCSNSFCI